MGFIESIISGALTKSLGKLFNRLLAWGQELFRRKEIVERSEQFSEETNTRVVAMETLQEKAKAEIAETGSVSEETREAIRQAGRHLVRGKRDAGYSDLH